MGVGWVVVGGKADSIVKRMRSNVGSQCGKIIHLYHCLADSIVELTGSPQLSRSGVLNERMII